jgi:hypothetical protein
MHNIETKPSIKITRVADSSSKGKSSYKDKNLLNFTASFDEDLMNMIINSNEETVVKADRIFSDSMIALHDENGSTNDLSSLISKSDSKSRSVSNNLVNERGEIEDGDEVDDNDEDWSNDFGWSQAESNGDAFNKNGEVIEATTKLSVDKETAIDSASLISLMGSELLDKSVSHNENVSISGSINSRDVKSNPASRLVGYVPQSLTNNSDQSFSQYDIKSIVVKKTAKTDPSDDLIENFLNEITPKIEKKMSDLNFGSANQKPTNGLNGFDGAKQPNGIDKHVVNDRLADKNAVMSDSTAPAKWDCDEISDLEDQ